MSHGPQQNCLTDLATGGDCSGNQCFVLDMGLCCVDSVSHACGTKIDPGNSHTSVEMQAELTLLLAIHYLGELALVSRFRWRLAFELFTQFPVVTSVLLVVFLTGSRVS